MRPINSAYDTNMSISTVTASNLQPGMVYHICDYEERILIWNTEYDSDMDDGSNALRTDFGDLTFDEIKELLRSSTLEEVY